MKLNLSLGDVARTHLKKQGRSIASIESSIRENCDLAIELLFDVPTYTGDSLPMAVSRWLVDNIGETTTYWRSVNKALRRYANAIYRTVDLQALKTYAAGLSPDPPKIEVDTIISANTVLGTTLLCIVYLYKTEMHLQNCVLKFVENFEYKKGVLWWRLLRKWSEQENPLEATIFDSADMLAIKYLATNDLYGSDDMFHFTSNNKDHWLSPIRAVAKSGDTMRIEWNPDFVSIMKQPVTSISPEDDLEENGIRWKDYI